jgi:hypothetical protein
VVIVSSATAGAGTPAARRFLPPRSIRVRALAGGVRPGLVARWSVAVSAAVAGAGICAAARLGAGRSVSSGSPWNILWFGVASAVLLAYAGMVFGHLATHDIYPTGRTTNGATMTGFRVRSWKA